MPLRRLGTPEEVIQTVMFLLSEDRRTDENSGFAVWLEVFQIALHAVAANYLAPSRRISQVTLRYLSRSSATSEA